MAMLASFLASLESEEDQKKFMEIYEQNHRRMERTAMYMLKNQSDAEDAIQNTMLQIIQHFSEVSEISCKEELSCWAIAILKNEARMILREKQKQRNQLLLLDHYEEETEMQIIENPTDQISLANAFAQLPETYRAVLEMKLLLGYTDREIAEYLGISETAVSTRASRGRALLRKLVEKEGFSRDRSGT